ncbi:MAG: hypothetical protein ACK452_06900, partial [Bacteroidota bacterium]
MKKIKIHLCWLSFTYASIIILSGCSGSKNNSEDMSGLGSNSCSATKERCLALVREKMPGIIEKIKDFEKESATKEEENEKMIAAIQSMITIG